MNDLRKIVKKLRVARKLTQGQVATAVRVSPSLIASIETGRLVPQPDTADRLDEFLDAGGQVREAAGLARDDATAPWLRPWTDHERRATLLRTFEPNLIPGLLQVESYARTILAAGPHSPKQVEEMTASRLARQATTLDRSDPVTLTAIVGEPALRYGDGPTMKSQLDHLVDIGQRATVHLRVIPTGSGLHAGLAGAFVVASLPGRLRVGYLDDQLRGRVVTDADEVGELERTWEYLSGLALPVDLSRDLILKVINGYD